ncbi:LPPG:FO 2-phospho-L-lactate transferase [Archaeoglobus sulfaticallidus PM70-1]|uniref:2-phospho-L-lactate transferase n=1 Tax=Archaeoglobus sulfaticallidus PM70-1 TaxID=387631 RepID=N0BFZ2_9EURY|nr:2-phospho-L-lactate transferase [Archaeoglobus sulfaticallidus]AGK61222.1 LPPG:FO 2-phospho-L-lactate transferase [Archaeoglobus sulfaticallidus PM70-1]
MIGILSGGTGTPKLIWGMKEIYDDFFVVVNTAEDVWVSGNKICPDIDSVIYVLSEMIDTSKWWGIKDDSFITHNQLRRLGVDEGMMIGDLDRATHIARTELLKRMDLVNATKELRKRFGIKQDVYPMCNEEVSTYIETADGRMHFQEFWVVRKGEPEVKGVFIENIDKAVIPEEVEKRLKEAEAVIIGPSNPITSIGPIISVRGYREILREKFVVAVSPIIGSRSFSGPAGKFMKALGYEVSSRGVVDIYQEFLDVLVIDEEDFDFEDERVEVVKAKTIMKTKEDAVKLAEFVLSLI